MKDNSTLEAIKEKITFSAGKAYTAGDTFTAVFEAEKGLYEIELNYRADKSGSSAPEITVLLDGEIPYNEAFGISLPLYYERGEPETDERGNQYTPELSLSTAEITARLYDATGYHRQALAFAARDGKNTLSIRFNEGGAELISVAIIPRFRRNIRFTAVILLLRRYATAPLRRRSLPLTVFRYGTPWAETVGHA